MISKKGVKVEEEQKRQEQIISVLKQQWESVEQENEPIVPKLYHFEQFTVQAQRDLHRRQTKELIIFLLAAVPITCGGLWMLGENTYWYAIIQTIITAAAAGYLIFSSKRKEAQE